MKTKSSTVKMDDGANICVHYWIPDGDVKGVVQLFHGMVEHAMRYDRFGSILAENGYALVADDHRGHGQTARDAEWNSNGVFGYLADGDGFERVVQDEIKITRKIKEDFPNKKIFVLGHSFGSVVAQAYIEENSTDIAGCIISGTTGPQSAGATVGGIIAEISRKVHGKYHISGTINKMTFGSYNKRIKNPASKNDWLTRDSMIVQLYDGDLWCGFTPTVSFFCDLFRGVRRVVRKKAVSNIMATLPIFFIYGAEDPTGRYGKGPHAVFEMYKKVGIKDVEEKCYEGARHELLNELCHEQVEKDILQWLSKH